MPGKPSSDKQSSVAGISRRHEIAVAGAWILLVNALALTPYVVGYWHSTTEAPFTGHATLMFDDFASHLAWAKQAYDGNLLFENQHSGNDTSTRLVFNLLFLVIGWTGRIFGVPVELANHAVRLVISILLLMVVYRFTSLFFRDRLWKWASLGFISFSAGFAWVEMLGLPTFWSDEQFYYWHLAPGDAFVMELSTFWHLRWEVVTTPTVLLLLLIFWCGLKFYQTHALRYALACSSTALLLGLVHPHNLLTVYSVLLVMAVINTWGSAQHCPRLHRWLLLLLVGLFSAPTLGYHGYVLMGESAMADYANIQDSITPVNLLLGYGIPGGLAIVAITQGVGARPHYQLLVVWVAVAFVLLFTPVPPAGQVFTLEGLHVPICILATKGLATTVEKWDRRMTGLTCSPQVLSALLVVLIGFASLTNWLALASEITLASRAAPPFVTRYINDAMLDHTYGIGQMGSNPIHSPYFLPRELRDAFDWLDNHTHPSDVVLAPHYMSPLIPLFSGNRVYLGHAALAHNPYHKEQRLRSFYNLQLASIDRHRFLQENDIAYVIFWTYSPKNRAARQQIARQVAAALPTTKVYQNRRVLVVKRQDLLCRAWPRPPAAGSGLRQCNHAATDCLAPSNRRAPMPD